VVCRLLEREKNGKGGFVDISLLGCAIALQQSAITAYIGDPVQPAKLGSAALYSAPNEAFRAKDGWIMVAAYMQPRWRKLCEVLGRRDLIDDERFSTGTEPYKKWLVQAKPQRGLNPTTRCWHSWLRSNKNKMGSESP